MGNNKILVLTPTFTGGSWVCVEGLLSFLKERFKYIVLGLGPKREGELVGVKVVRIPYFMFDRLSSGLGSNIFFNYFYQFPLMLASTVAVLVCRPAVVLSNGFTPVLLAMPVCRVLKIPIIIYYGSFLERVVRNKFIFALFKRLDGFVSAVFVNSEGSRYDVSRFIDFKKTLVIENWTDLRPMSDEQRQRLRRKLGVEKKFVVAFVGKLSKDKPFDYLLKIAEKLKDSQDVEVWFVGAGPLSQIVTDAAAKLSNVKYFGFVRETKKLAELYTAADILWGYADETYLARPAIESLAVGTPIMVPNTPAILEKKGRVTLSPTLFPSSVGWLVDINNLDEAISTVNRFKNNPQSYRLMRRACAEYAGRRYSRNNIEAAVEVLSTLSGAKDV